MPSTKQQINAVVQQSDLETGAAAMLLAAIPAGWEA